MTTSRESPRLRTHQPHSLLKPTPPAWPASQSPTDHRLSLLDPDPDDPDPDPEPEPEPDPDAAPSAVEAP